MNDISSVVVIGGGVSGLASAVLLARAGLEVTLVERDERLAPLIRNYDYQGFVVSNGFHYLGGYYPGGALQKSFEHLGIDGRLKPVQAGRRGIDRFSGFIGGDIVLPVGRDAVRSVLESRFPGSRQALAEYFEVMDRVFGEFSFLNIENYSRIITPSLVNISLQDFMDDRKAEKSLTAFLGAYSEILLGMTAEEVSLLTHLLGVGAYFYSVHTFEGGGGALARALEDSVRESGVRVLTGLEAVAVESESRRQFSGLRVRSTRDGSESMLRADACVSTMHPKRLLRLLPREAAYKLFARRVRESDDTKAVLIFHLALTGEAGPDLTMNYHRAFWDETGRLRHHFTLLPDITGNHASPGAEKRLSVILTAWENDRREECPEGYRESCYDRTGLPAYAVERLESERFEDSQREMDNRLTGVFPDMKGRYKVVGVLSPCHLDRLNATWQGAVYGVKCSYNRLGLLPVGPMRGLLLAGQSITAPGIFGALASAYLACGRIIKGNELS